MRGPQQWSNQVNAWNRKVIEDFRANGGRVGGPFAGQPLVLLHTTGARTGIERVTPMVCFEEDSHLYVFASKDGADSHPDWFHNVRQDSMVYVEVDTRSFGAVARILDEPERAAVFARASARFPRLAQNATMTTRVIPVIDLVAD